MFTFHWRGGYLTKAVLDELLDLIQKAGKEKQKNARISLNWPQAVIRFDYVEDHGEAEPEVVVEEANERRERIVFDIKNGHPHRMPERKKVMKKKNDIYKLGCCF